MSLKTDYKDYVPSTPLKKYNLVNNPDGTVSFQDATDYTQVGDKGQASVFNAIGTEVNAHEANENVHITQLSCTKSTTVYALTGTLATSGLMPCMFASPAAYVAGDTFTVNGVAYTVQTSNGVALGAFASGATINVTLDVTNHKINFKGDPTIPTSLPANGGNSDTVDSKHASDFIWVANSVPVKIQSTAPADTTALWAW